MFQQQVSILCRRAAEMKQFQSRKQILLPRQMLTLLVFNSKTRKTKRVLYAFHMKSLAIKTCRDTDFHMTFTLCTFFSLQ